MVGPSRAVFRARLAALSAGERARFVVDVFRARGWTGRIDEDGAGVVVRLERGTRCRVLLIHETSWLSFVDGVPEEVDGVVVPGSGHPWWVPAGVTVIDGDALYERTIYAVDAPVRRRLIREYLVGPSIDVDENVVPGSRRRRRFHAVIAVVALAVVATAVLGVPGMPGTSTTESVDGAVATPTPFVGSSADPTTTETPDAVRTPVPADAFPPGVNETGIVDPTALLGAHAEVLQAGNYRLVMVYTEHERSPLPVGDSRFPSPAVSDERRAVSVVGERRLFAAVGESLRVETSVTTTGDVYGIADPVTQVHGYAEGMRLYHRLSRANRTRYEAEYGSTTVGFGQSYLEEALRVDSSRLLGTTVYNGIRLFEFRFSGDGDPRTENVTGTLVVDDRGVVRSFVRRYDANATVVDAPADVSVTVSLRYEFATTIGERPP